MADSSATGMTSSAKIFCWRMPRVVGSKCEFYILTYTDIATSITGDVVQSLHTLIGLVLILTHSNF
jgi:hypothetical protein